MLFLIAKSDEFRRLEADRLRPFGDLNDPRKLEQYKDYLEWFYNLNKRRHPVTSSVVDAAFEVTAQFLSEAMKLFYTRCFSMN
jgi:hypothetical protein